MLKLAVVGKDVSKSLSPKMHRFIAERTGFRCEYEKISLSEGEFSERAEELFTRLDGFNVTIPHKRNIIPFLKKLEGDAAVFGAVNTVVSKTRTGFNTDGTGFLSMLAEAGVEIEKKRVLIIGAGGAGRSCIYALARAGAEVAAVGRRRETLEAVYEKFKDFTPLTRVSAFEFDLIVNCTGIGMHDTEGQTPFVPDTEGQDCLPKIVDWCETAVDLIYEPKKSAFLRLAEDKGKRTLNGESMLFYQAYAADCIFTGEAYDGNLAKKLWKEYREENL